MNWERLIGCTGLGMVTASILYEMQPFGPSSPYVMFCFMTGIICIGISNSMRELPK